LSSGADGNRERGDDSLHMPARCRVRTASSASSAAAGWQRSTWPKTSSTTGPWPPETVALSIRLVRALDAAMLASFVDRTCRTWSRASLKPLEAAVKARRAELETP